MKIILITFLSLLQIAQAEACQRLEIHGHRGFWDRLENSVPAFLKAAEVGADKVEMDLHITKDDQVIVIHDAWIRDDLCLDAKGGKLSEKIYVRNITLEQVKKFQCGSLVKPGQTELPNTPIPTLQEVFAALRNIKTLSGSPLGMNIEIKFYDNHPEWYPNLDKYLDLFLTELKTSHFEPGRIIVQSFNSEILKALKQREPEIKIALLSSEPEKALAIAQEIGASAITPDFHKLTKKLVKEMQSAGLKVIPWTVNDPGDMKKLRNMGVDGLITDRADLVYKSKNASCTER